MEIVVCVHEIEHEPENAGMWRWAVHIGRDFADPLSCLNAGVEGDQHAAEDRGQGVAVAAARVAERCGQLEFSGEPTTVVLDHDPCGTRWALLNLAEDY